LNFELGTFFLRFVMKAPLRVERNFELGTWNLELGTFFLRFAMKAPLRVERNIELGTWNIELGTLNIVTNNGICVE